MFKERKRAKSHEHIVYFLANIIRNQFSLQEQEFRKEKCKVYSRVLEFVNAFELEYSPLADKKYWGAKIDMLMNNFAGFMQTLNEKKEILTQTYPNKAIEVENRLASRAVINSG